MLYLSLLISIATIACGTFQAMIDNCSNDGNLLVKIRAPQDHYYIDCNNGNPICLPCAANLHWSPKCQQCEYYKNDTLNECSLSLFGAQLLPAEIIPGASESLDDAFTKSKSSYDGHCNISPNNGTSLETTFKISCQDWKSSVSSLNYHVWLHKEANENQLLSYGSVPEFHLLLPAGDESTHYMVNISVEIIDLHEASTSFPFYVQVFPSEELTQELLLNLTSGENNKFDELSVKGDTQGLMQLISIVGESMSKAQGKEAENETTVNGTKTKAAQQRTQLRSTMVEALAKVELQSSENIIQIGNALAMVLSSPEEVTKKTEGLALQLLSQMANFSETKSKEVNIPSVDIKDTSTSIFSEVGAFTESQEAVEAPVNQTENAKVDIDTSDFSNRKKERNILKETLDLILKQLVPGERDVNVATSRVELIPKHERDDLKKSQEIPDIHNSSSNFKLELPSKQNFANSSSNPLDVFDGLYLTKTKAKNDTGDLDSLSLFDGLNLTNTIAKINTDDLNILNPNIVETNITYDSSSIISPWKLIDIKNSSQVVN